MKTRADLEPLIALWVYSVVRSPQVTRQAYGVRKARNISASDLNKGASISSQVVDFRLYVG